MTTPTFTLPTSGSDPRRATKESLEENINQIIQYLDNARISGDAALMSGLEFQGGWDASTNTFPDQGKDGGPITKGDFFWVSVKSTFGGTTYSINEPLVALVDDPSTTNSSDWYHTPINSSLTPLIDQIETLSTPNTSASIPSITTRTLGDRVFAHDLNRWYRWSVDCTFKHAEIALDVIRPDDLTEADAGRWIMDPVTEISPRNIALPKTGIKLRDTSVAQDVRIALLMDSFGAPHQTIPAGESMKSWWQRIVGGGFCTSLSQLRNTDGLGGTTGATVSVSNDFTKSVIGDYYDVGVGTYRWIEGGVNPQVTGVRIPYIQRPGGGSFTVHLEAVDTSEVATVTVDCDGPLTSKVVDLTLSGEVTGKLTGQRLYVDVEVTSVGSHGSLEFLRAAGTFDTTQDVTRLHYYEGFSKGGTNPDPDTFAANADVLIQQIVDQEPDLIMVQAYDQVEQHRNYMELLVTEFRTRGLRTDILVIGTPLTGGGDTIEIDGEDVERRTLVSTYFRALSERAPEVQFFDLGAIVRSADWGTDTNYAISPDVHPTADEGAAFIATQLTKAIGNFRSSTGPEFLPETIVDGDFYFGALNGRDIDDVTSKGKLSYASAGDARLDVHRDFQIYQNNTGAAVRKLKVAVNHVSPGADNTQSAGVASLRYSLIYAATGSINTSDRREKQQIGPIPDKWLDAWADVQWSQFKWNESVEEKGDDARWHVGLIAQDILEAFSAHGLDAFDVGVLCYDEWPDEYDEGGNLTIQAGNRYGVRYDQAQALEAAFMRRALKLMTNSK